MNILKPICFAIIGLTTSAAVGEAQLSLNYASSPGATIEFNGAADSFQFNPSTFAGFGGIFLGTQWYIGSETGGTDSATGLTGSVLNGPFSYRTIIVNGSEQTAIVTGPLGQMVINDGANIPLTGTVDWTTVSTFGDAGAINASVQVNVTDLQYAGLNPDLQTLAAAGSGSMILTFQFSPGQTLTDLSSGDNSFITSYYFGSISTVVPEPSSVALGLVAFAGLVCFRFLRPAKISVSDQK